MAELDDAIVRKLRAGELSAIDLLVQQHGVTIQRLTWRLCGGHADSQDLAQDVLVIAMQKGHTFRQQSSLETWLCGIAVRVCRKWIRRQRVRRRFFQWAMHTWPTSTQLVPQPHYEIQEWVQNGIDLLPIADRELLLLRYVEQRSIDEIAAILSVSRSALDQRLHRARTRLSILLKVDSMPQSTNVNSPTRQNTTFEIPTNNAE